MGRVCLIPCPRGTEVRMRTNGCRWRFSEGRFLLGILGERLVLSAVGIMAEGCER